MTELLATASLLELATLAIAVATALGLVPQTIAAIGIWFGIRAMNRGNAARAAQAAEDRKQAAEDRAEDRRQAAEDRRQAAEDRKTTQAMLASLERQGRVLEELLRRGTAQ